MGCIIPLKTNLFFDPPFMPVSGTAADVMRLIQFATFSCGVICTARASLKKSA